MQQQFVSIMAIVMAANDWGFCVIPPVMYPHKQENGYQPAMYALLISFLSPFSDKPSLMGPTAAIRWFIDHLEFYMTVQGEAAV